VDDSFADEVNENAIDPALKRLAAQVPEAFVPDNETVTIFGDLTSTSLGRTLSATVDEWVLDFGTVASGGAIAVNGTWDGIMHLEVDYGGRTYRRQCREFWQQSVEKSLGSHYLVSLTEPWNFPDATGMTFRLFQKYVYTRDDVTKVLDGRLFDAKRMLIDILPAGFVRYAYVEDFKGQSVSTPTFLSRWGHRQIPAPNRTPTVALTNAANWSTSQEPPGKFKYRATLVWGRRTAEHRAPGGSFDPTWESSPGPESASITVNPLPSNAVLLSGLTNIDWQLNFNPTDVTMLRAGHSGMRTRIYRARESVVTGGIGTNETNVEFPGVYFFLAEIDGSLTSYIDDGTAIPDYSRRIPESHGYWEWAVTPHQNADYEMDLRVDRRPAKLQCDSDAPQVHPDFEPMLLDLVLSYVCQIDKSPADAAVYEGKFDTKVKEYRAKDANPADYVPAVPWKPPATLEWPYPFGPFKTV
jgi:hypothetical protein